MHMYIMMPTTMICGKISGQRQRHDHAMPCFIWMSYSSCSLLLLLRVGESEIHTAA